jgi:hypothetical protein
VVFEGFPISPLLIALYDHDTHDFVFRAMMNADLFNHRSASEQIEGICLRLFDTWCETRNLTPLAFLMHCWPLISVETSSLKHLSDTLGELRRSHGAAVGDNEAGLLLELEERIEEMRLHTTGGHDDRIERMWASSKVEQLCRLN